MNLIQLGDVVDIKGGGTPDKSVAEYWGGSIPWASVKDFKSTLLDKTSDFITDAGVRNSATNIIPAGTIIVPTRMAVGKAAVSGVAMAINQDLKALFPKRNVDTRYLLHALLASSGELERQATGATVKGITLGALRGLKIPLPALTEQRRIAGILDQADALRRKRVDALSRLNALGQAIFYEMFGDPVSNPMGWDKVALVDCCAASDDIRCGPFGTQLLKTEFCNSGVPLWGIKQVNRGFAIPTHEYVTDQKARELSNYDIVEDDIVMTRKGTIGNCAVYPAGLSAGVMHSDLLRVRLDQRKSSPQFVADQLHFSRDVERQIDLISGGAIMQGINVGKLKQIKVILPPLRLQKVYMERIKAVTTQTSFMKKHLEGQNSLFASLQHRAFCGEL